MEILWDSNQITTTKMKKETAIQALLRQAISSELQVRDEDVSISIEGQMADVKVGFREFSVYLSERRIKGVPAISYTSAAIDIIRATGAKYMLIHSERGRIGYFVEVDRELNFSAQLTATKDEENEDVWTYYLVAPITLCYPTE